MGIKGFFERHCDRIDEHIERMTNLYVVIAICAALFIIVFTVIEIIKLYFG